MRKVEFPSFPKWIILIAALFFGISGCGSEVGRTAADTIADAIPEITGESEQWRKVWNETREELPEDVRKEFDLAFNKAISAAGAEFKCSVDFIRSRLRQDLQALVSKLRLGEQPSPDPHVCQTSKEVIELDSNLQVKEEGWIRFAGYDLDSPDVEILLKSRDDSTKDLKVCCLDDPTHYLMTVDFDEVSFLPDHRRLLIKWPNDEISVAINQPPRYHLIQDDTTYNEVGGGTGGGERTLSCGNGEIVTGYEGFWGPHRLPSGNTWNVVLKIQLVCKSVEANGILTRQEFRSAAGGRGNRNQPIPYTRHCPKNQALVGFHARTGNLVDYLEGICAPITDLNTSSVLPFIGLLNEGQKRTFRCNRDYVITQLNLRSGSAIDQLNFTCTKVASVR